MNRNIDEYRLFRFIFFDASMQLSIPIYVALTLFSATRILILGGDAHSGSTSKSGVLSLSQNVQGSFQGTYEPSQDYFKSM